MMVFITRMLKDNSMRLFVGAALGVLLGLLIYNYGWGFFLQPDGLAADAAKAVGVKAATNVQTTDVDDVRVLGFEADMQYGYTAYVRHPLLPLYKRTMAFLNYKPLEAGETLNVEGFSHTYTMGVRKGSLSPIGSVNQTTLGFNWMSYASMVAAIGLVLYGYSYMQSMRKRAS